MPGSAKAGSALGKQGKYDEVIKAYEEAIRLDPKLAMAWYNKGNALDDLGKYYEAIKAYDEAIRLDPNDVAAWASTMRLSKPMMRLSS